MFDYIDGADHFLNIHQPFLVILLFTVPLKLYQFPILLLF